MNAIDKKAFQFVERIAKPPDNYFQRPPGLAADMHGESTEEMAHLGDVGNLAVCHYDPSTGIQLDYFDHSDSGLVGLDLESHREFAKLINELLNAPQLKGRCDFKFLIREACEWLFSVYRNQKASLCLTDYLLNRVESEMASYTFRFRIAALQIEEEFVVGNSTFSVVSEEQAKAYCDEIRQLHPEMGFQEDSWSLFAGGFVTVTGHSTQDFAQQRALEDAELSVDLLRCFLTDYVFHDRIAFPELTHRKVGPQRLECLSYSSSDMLAPYPSIKSFNGIVPIPIDRRLLNEAQKNGLQALAEFIKRPYEDFLAVEIRSAISRFADAISVYSPHQRIVRLISMLESIFMSKDHSSGHTTLKKALPGLSPIQEGKIKTVLKRMYMVRDAYMHHWQRMSIDPTDLHFMLWLVRVFIIELVSMHEEGKRTKEDIVKRFLSEL